MISATPFTVSCPSCLTEFPVDPEKVPVEGVHAICSTCLRVFPVERPGANGSAESTLEAPAFQDPSPLASEALAELEAESEMATEAAEVETSVETDVQDERETEGEIEQPAESIEAEGEAYVEVDTAAEDESAAEPVAESAEPEETVTAAERPSTFEDLSSLASDALSYPNEEPDSAAGGPVTGALYMGASRFGARDPHDRARRLARVLVSDIIAYYPGRYRESLSQGTLKEDFEAEVAKSRKEYLDQVGSELAESAPYFNEALNEILAKGGDVF